MRKIATLIALVLLSFTGKSAQQPATVEKKGQESQIKFEQVISGHLTEVNGKYKLRITETTYEPEGYIGDHHHVGPGIRLVEIGELTYVQPG